MPIVIIYWIMHCDWIPVIYFINSVLIDPGLLREQSLRSVQIISRDFQQG